MGEARRKFDADFREGAVRLARETGKPIAQVARDLGINAGTLGNWVNADARRGGDGALSEDERAELGRLRKENAELSTAYTAPASENGQDDVRVDTLRPPRSRPHAVTVPSVHPAAARAWKRCMIYPESGDSPGLAN